MHFENVHVNHYSKCVCANLIFHSYPSLLSLSESLQPIIAKTETKPAFNFDSVRQVLSPHYAPCKGIRIPESRKCCLRKPDCDEVLLVESGIPGFGIRNPAQEISPTIRLRNLSSIDKESRIHGSDPESKTVLDSLIWGDTF